MTKRQQQRQRLRTVSDRRLRSWVFELLANSDLAPEASIASMEQHVQWIKTGRVPGRPAIRLVKSGEGA